MIEDRKIDKILKSKATIEGAGVKLKRVFGYQEVPMLDPFLLLDHFGSDNPADYMAGFPWHPHRGIETVTYMLSGEVEHGDSLGNSGTIQSGDVQWMTAGSAIIHQEMPQEYNGLMQGFQLWVNLPKANKMMEPRYRDVKKKDIPEIQRPDGITIKVISGQVDGVSGPVQDIVVDIQYLDVTMPPNYKWQHPITKGYKAFAYVITGEGFFDTQMEKIVANEHLAVFQDGDRVSIASKEQELRFLLVSGEPLGEPVAWGGPIVMNTQEELNLAFKEFNEGTFIKHH